LEGLTITCPDISYTISYDEWNEEEISGQVMVVKFVSPPLQAVISGLHVMLPLPLHASSVRAAVPKGVNTEGGMTEGT
jgi:hypothetical protein